MRRLLVVAAVLAAAAVAVAIAAIVRDNGSGDKTVQAIAGHRITQNHLELTVEADVGAGNVDGGPVRHRIGTWAKAPLSSRTSGRPGAEIRRRIYPDSTQMEPSTFRVRNEASARKLTDESIRE
jgi:hypothetical protein